MKFYLLLRRDEDRTAVNYHATAHVPLYDEYKNAKRGRAYHCHRGKNESKEDHLARQEANWKIVSFNTEDLVEVFE